MIGGRTFLAKSTAAKTGRFTRRLPLHHAVDREHPRVELERDEPPDARLDQTRPESPVAETPNPPLAKPFLHGKGEGE